MKLNGKVTQVETLSRENREQMFRLMRKCYANVNRRSFERDLDHKQWAILVYDLVGTILGFTTQTIVETSVNHRTLTSLFSGDTVVSPEYWGKNPLFQIWGRLALALIDRHPGQELDWFLISKGPRTYRTLPLFFHEFWPRFDRKTPPELQQVINHLGARLFPDSFDLDAGIIRAGAADYHLREGASQVNEQRKTDPHVRFFKQRNPGYVRGDELCCLAPLTRKNFKPAAYRVIGTHEPVEL